MVSGAVVFPPRTRICAIFGLSAAGGAASGASFTDGFGIEPVSGDSGRGAPKTRSPAAGVGVGAGAGACARAASRPRKTARTPARTPAGMTRADRPEADPAGPPDEQFRGTLITGPYRPARELEPEPSARLLIRSLRHTRQALASR